MDRQLRDLIEIIHFTENVSAKIHGLLDEREIYRTVSEEFAKSQRYTATILLLIDDGAKLGIAETSISAEKVKAGEKAAGVRLHGYKIDLEKSTIYSQVVEGGATVQVNVSDIIGELFPRPLAYLISKIMGYEKSPSILTALKRRGKIIGVLAMTSADLAEYLIPSVRSLAQHISIALELADEQAERKRAQEELNDYRDHLEELVEVRTAELIKANEQLQRQISERQRAENALRESEERYRGLFDEVPVGVNLTTPEGQIIDANPALVEMLGYRDRESLLAVNAADLYADPDNRQRWQALIAREGVMRGFEVQLRRCDGTSIWVQSNARTVCDADGRVTYYEGTLEDISERKRAEESLRESEKRYRSFVQNFQGIAYRGYMDFAPTFLHGAVEAITGYAEDNFTAGKLRWDQIIHPEDLPNIFTEDERKLHSIPDYSYEREYRILREDGQIRWVHEIIQNICDSSGKPVMVQGAIYDITERKRAEEELRESEQKHRTLIEQSLQGIIIAQGPSYPRLVFANPAMANILGYTIDELTSLSPQETAGLVHPDDRQFFFQRFADRLEGKAAEPRYEFRAIRKDGALRWLEISASRIEYQGQPAVQAAFVDITERKMAERALEQRATQLSMVGEIGRQIASILDPDELLRQTVDLLEGAFGYLFVYIFLLDEGSRELVLRAGAGATGRTLEGTRLAIEARSINTFVSRTGEPLLANDVSQEPMYLLLAGVAHTKSELAVPIKVKDRVMGTLDVQSTELDAFDESDLFTLQALASQVAIAIENARLYEDAQQRIGELAGLHELSQAFSSVTDVRETYGELTKRIAKLIGCQACTIATYDQRRRQMRAQPPGYGAPDEVVQSFRYSVDGPARDAWNFRLRGPLLANDVTQIPDFFLQWLEGFDVFNLLIVPMALEGKITGLVYAANKPGGFAEGDSGLLTIFASQAAVIIENARLYEETRRWAEEMTSVYNVGVATTSTLNVDEVLNLVGEQVRHLLEVSSFYIALYDAEKEELCFELALDDGVPLAKFTRRLADGAGLSGWIVRSKQPLLIRDAERDELPAGAIVVGLPARSWLAVPLLYLGRVVGVMGVQSYQPNAFDETDQELLSTIATQVATAIENARLFTETTGRAKDLALLLGTSTAISSSLDLDQILKTVARQIITSLVATFCRIALLDDTGEKLIIRAVYPIREQVEDNLGRQCPLGVVPWHKRVIETGEPVILRQDVPELTLSDEECEMILTERVQSAVLIPLIVGGRMLGVISLGEERSWGRSPFTSEKVSLCQSIAAQAAVAIENARLYEELRQSFLQTIAALAAAVDAKDPHTGGHSQRTTELAAAIAQELRLGEAEIELIRYAGLLHDLGKIGIGEQILRKPGALDAEEWEAVRKHPALGANIVERVAALQQLVPVIMHHHERYDGWGYPAGLRGENIPLKARILSVADAYEAMTSDRAYRLAMTVKQALATLREGAEKQWDGKMVDVLCRIIQGRGDEA